MNTHISYIPIEKKHADCLYQWFNDPKFNRWFFRDFPINSLMVEELILNEMKREIPLFFIQSLEESIGFFKLHELDFINRKVELTLGIGNENFRGRGYGTDLLDFALSYIFKKLNLEQVYLYVYSNNINAKKLYEKFGFRVEGEFRVLKYYNGNPLSGCRMSLFRNDFVGNRNNTIVGGS